MPINAVLYARYSSDNQSEESITAQVRAGKEYCQKKGYNIVEIYIDRAFSARSDARPEFQRMISDSKYHRFQKVVVHKLDRFSRDRYDHAIYKKELKKHHVSVESVLENLDDSPESVVLESVLEGFSEYYSRNLGRETRKGLKEVALQAKFTGGCPPFGYDVDADNHYIINPIEAAAVRQIFDACLAGTGYGPLLDDFQKRGIKTKFGRSFGKNSLNAILKNKKYMGTYVYYPVGTEKQKLSEPIVIEDAIPPIVDKQTFMEVQKIMESRAHTGRLKAVEPYLLSGILFCGACGSAMNGHRRNRNGNPEYNYECGSNARKKTCSMRNFSRDKLESIVCAYVRRLFSDDALAEIQIYLKENTDRINRDNIKAQHALEREISSLDTKIENVINLLIDTPSSKLKEKLMSLEARQKELSVELEQLQCATLSNDKIDQYILRLNHFDDMNREEKQFYIKKAIKKITAYADGNLEILTTYSNVVDKVRGATQI